MSQVTNNEATSSFPTTTTTTIIIAVTVGVLVLLLCVILSTLVLCRYHRNHKKQYHIEEMEITKSCSSPEECSPLGEVSPPESHLLQHDKLREDKKNPPHINGEEEVGHYSSLQEVKKPELKEGNKEVTPQHYAKLDEAFQAENEEAFTDTLYSSADEVKMVPTLEMDALRGSSNDKKVHFSAPQNEFSPHPSAEEETSIDQLYTQVKKVRQEVPVDTHTPENAPDNQFYAQVTKKKKRQDENNTIEIVGAGLPTDELYAQVDKKKKEHEDSPQESGAVYAVVNKPEIPEKSDSLIEDLQGFDNL